jgi:hypothetical protein
LGILEAPCKNMGLRHGACINAAFFVTHWISRPEAEQELGWWHWLGQHAVHLTRHSSPSWLFPDLLSWTHD